MLLNVDATMLAGAITARKLTLKDVAQQANVSVSHLRAMIHGRRTITTDTTVSDLARVLNIDPFFIARPDTQ